MEVGDIITSMYGVTLHDYYQIVEIQQAGTEFYLMCGALLREGGLDGVVHSMGNSRNYRVATSGEISEFYHGFSTKDLPKANCGKFGTWFDKVSKDFTNV